MKYMYPLSKQKLTGVKNSVFGIFIKDEFIDKPRSVIVGDSIAGFFDHGSSQG